MQVELPGVILVGTAHVSDASVREVRETIARERPAVVAVELDENRLKALRDPKRFEETPITELLKGGKSFFILAQTMLASFQRRMGAKTGVQPGGEMLVAVEDAEALGAEVALVDRDIGVTLRRAWSRMGFREKARLGWEMFKAMLGAEEEEEVEVDELLEEDVLTAMMAELGEMAPSVSEVLIRERDAYLASKIHEASKKGKVVAVLGAGHLKGVEAYLRAPETIPDIAPLTVIPRPRVQWGKLVGIGMIVLVASIMIYHLVVGIQQGNLSTFRDLALTWIVVNGVLSALGALLARGHPLSIATAFVASPITSLNPTLAAGWFAGLAEAKVRTPTVGDFHAVSSMQTLREFWNNRLMRVLLVTALANLGSMAGSWISAVLIATGRPISFAFLGIG